MIHYVLHFKRCQPPITSQIIPQAIPAETSAAYGASVQRVFVTPFENVDELKVPIETELRRSLEKLGVPPEAL
jgi:hypothetical protein